MSEEKKEKLIDKLKHKYRLTISNDDSFKEVMSFRLSQLNLFTILGVMFLLTTLLSFMLLIYTPLSRFLPTVTDTDTQRQIINTAMQIDTLEFQIRIRDQYIYNLRNIIEGKEIVDFSALNDSAFKAGDLSYEPSLLDSAFREQMEANSLTGLEVATNETEKEFSQIHFFAPINKGMVINKFNLAEDHYGVDIAGAANEGVKAVLDGTVISATWTLATGYVISIQHENDLISFYKHNSAILKREGDNVKAGEVIAIIGNTGELSTGPHLHFELWHKGVPLNPEDYIIL